jgi:hypothetical protein
MSNKSASVYDRRRLYFVVKEKQHFSCRDCQDGHQTEFSETTSEAAQASRLFTSPSIPGILPACIPFSLTLQNLVSTIDN